MVPEVVLRPLDSASDASDTPQVIRHRFAAFRYENVGVLPFFLDMISIVAAAICAGIIYDTFAKRDQNIEQYVTIGAALVGSFVPIAKLNNLYSLKSLLASQHIRQLSSSWALSCLMLATLLFASRASDVIPRGLATSIVLMAIIFMAFCRACAAAYVRTAMARGWLRTVRIVLLGSPPSIRQNQEMLASLGFAVVKELEIDENAPLDNLEAVIRHARTFDVDEIHVAVDDDRAAAISRLVASLRSLPITIRWIPTPELAGFLTQPASPLASRPSFKVHRPPLSEFERTVKRVFDLTFALTVLICLAPAFVVLAVLVRLDSHGPTFFMQWRRGFNGRPFRIYKFRTMTTLDDGEVIRQATRGDVRVTRIGRWLRRTSLDEVPQILNVLRGEMSMVGPRPHAVAHDDAYGSKISQYAYRHNVKPGITGWAQINGARGETRSTNCMMRRVKLDLWYISNWSILLDLWIIFRTIGAIFSNKDAY